MIKLIRATCGQWLLYWTAQLGARWKHGHFGYHRDQRAPEAFVPQCLQCQALVKVSVWAGMACSSTGFLAEQSDLRTVFSQLSSADLAACPMAGLLESGPSPGGNQGSRPSRTGVPRA